jgi:hypothetical protein
MSRTSALGRASRAVDNSTSAQFRVRKAKGKVIQTMDNYFEVNKNKFRPYKIRKGKKKGLTNQFIEVRKHRIDTRGEKMGLKLAQLSKSMKWRIPTKVKNKTKSKRRKK